MENKNHLRKTALAALIVEMLTSLCAHAQVVVSGIRASLSSSLTTKRLQDGVVDAVSAEDAGKFPTS
jgi:hypothetical protein